MLWRRWRWVTRCAFVGFLCVGLSATTHGQDAGKIVDEYVKAVGGKKALERVQSETLEGTFTGADGKAGTYTLDLKVPNRYYSELVTGDRNFIEAYNGKSAWRRDAAGGLSTLVGPAGMEMEAAAQIGNSRLTNLKKNKIALAFIGHAEVRGRDTLQVEATTATGMKREVFFDAQTHFIAKESAAVGGVEEEMLFDDYRAVDGVKVPHHLELRRGGDSYDIRVTRASINATVGERVFDFPKKSQVQLPDLKALFKEIDENQKAIDRIKENYAGTRTEEETEFESNGRVKKRELTEYNFFYLDGDEVSTLVKKDGKPLGEAEQKKEEEKAQKQIADLQKRQTKKEAKEQRAEEQGKPKDSDDPGIEVFLRACQFVNPRRERFRGQEVLVFDFEPNPEFKAHTLAEKVVQKLAGVIWVDEKAHDVARLEAYFVGDMRFAGGIVANLQKGTSFVMEQAYINDEVWLPTYFEVHVGVRVLMLKGFRMNQVTRYSDYKKFNVDTLSKIGKPEEKNGGAQTHPVVPN